MKIEKAKDLPLGILLMVISQFFVVLVHDLIKTNYWYTLPLVLLCSIAYWKFFNVGWRIAFEGINIDVEE